MPLQIVYFYIYLQPKPMLETFCFSIFKFLPLFPSFDKEVYQWERSRITPEQFKHPTKSSLWIRALLAGHVVLPPTSRGLQTAQAMRFLSQTRLFNCAKSGMPRPAGQGPLRAAICHFTQSFLPQLRASGGKNLLWRLTDRGFICTPVSKYYTKCWL